MRSKNLRCRHSTLIIDTINIRRTDVCHDPFGLLRLAYKNLSFVFCSDSERPQEEGHLLEP